jgi:hypothetical protein
MIVGLRLRMVAVRRLGTRHRWFGARLALTPCMFGWRRGVREVRRQRLGYVVVSLCMVDILDWFVTAGGLPVSKIDASRVWLPMGLEGHRGMALGLRREAASQAAVLSSLMNLRS